MGQWPPSPSVEDEITALANEHSIDASLPSVKSDDQPAPSRGSIDQYPILIDTSALNEGAKADGKKTSVQQSNVTDTFSSDDSAGPPTPPPLVRKPEKKPRETYNEYESCSTAPVAVPERAGPADRPTSSRGRPQITRIQTDVGGDVRAMAAGSRRPPSPYSYSRMPTYHGSVSGYKGAEDSYLSPEKPTFATVTPNSRQRTKSVTPPRDTDRIETPTSSSRPSTAYFNRSKSERQEVQPPKRDYVNVRADTQPFADTKVTRNATTNEKRRSQYGASERLGVDYSTLSPSHSRRASRESKYGSSSEDITSSYSPRHSRAFTREIHESPYTSSTEDSSREYRRRGDRSERSSEDEKHRSRRKSSHRRERPTFIDLGKNVRSESLPASAVDSSESKHYRREPHEKRQIRPITPLTADANKAAVENYFERAFQENEMRRSQRHPGPRSSGSTLASPLASPPRTPKTDRQSKDYFEFTSTAPRPVQRSRPPSMDEGQIMDSKIHSSLLSAATAGAALAARSSGTSSKSSGQSTEVAPSATASTLASGIRSGRSSPVRDEPSTPTRVIHHSPAESMHIPKGSLTPTYDVRPVSRGNVNGSDISFTCSQSSSQPHPPPQRAMSYSGLEHIQPWNSSYPASTISPTYAAISTAPSHSNTVPQPRSARTSINPVEFPSPVRPTPGLPVCPRSQPVVGYHDWFTIKEISDVDICPTCTSVVANTRYRDLFVPSLPRPYNEPSVCAMSKPWVRVAFMQSMRQNRPDLSYIKAVTNMPRDTKPCSGTKIDARPWFSIMDPQSKDPVPDFWACTACVRFVDKLFPSVCQLFDRPKNRLSQEHSCSMHTGSIHFQSIIDHLEQAQIRCKGRNWRSADVEPLVRHVRRVARYRPCPRDEMQASRAWHFMSDLPELTICEECYDQVVWPLADRPIAREISKTLKNVGPRRNSNGNSPISCQLYSERMRKLFRDAVNYREFGPLRDAVRTRVSAQQRLTEMNKLYEQDLKCGIDRRQELDRNHEIWRNFE